MTVASGSRHRFGTRNNVGRDYRISNKGARPPMVRSAYSISSPFVDPPGQPLDATEYDVLSASSIASRKLPFGTRLASRLNPRDRRHPDRCDLRIRYLQHQAGANPAAQAGTSPVSRSAAAIHHGHGHGDRHRNRQPASARLPVSPTATPQSSLGVGAPIGNSSGIDLQFRRREWDDSVELEHRPDDSAGRPDDG
jgi:hypothetical protein